jgi:hypothetical protein
MIKLHEDVLATLDNQSEEDDFIDEDDNESTFVIRGKWILDGSDTLLDAAAMARDYADFLESLHEEGYELVKSIEDDYGFAKLTVG